MPKHKKTKKKVHHKKPRHMGALSLKDDQTLLMMAGGVLTGAVVKRLSDTLIAKAGAKAGFTASDNLVNFGEVVAGGAMFYLIDQPFLRGMGLGLAGSAVYSATANLKLAGLGAGPLVPFPPRPNLSGGVTQTPAIAGGAGNVYNFPKPAGVGKARHYAGSHMR